MFCLNPAVFTRYLARTFEGMPYVAWYEYETKEQTKKDNSPTQNKSSKVTSEIYLTKIKHQL